MNEEIRTRKRTRFVSESAYQAASVFSVQLLLTSIWDGIILTLNATMIAAILLVMGLIQTFLTISEDYFFRSPSSVLRFRKGKEIFYWLIPTRMVSRLWGFIHGRRLVYFTRPIIFRLYSLIYGVKIDEAKNQNLYYYTNLGEFFRRELRSGVRPMSRDRLVSPSDGKVLVAGKVKDGMIDQVKGSSFTVAQFLGPSPTATAGESSQGSFMYKGDDSDNRVRYCQDLLHDPEANEMYYCVIYLAPGDYHRFHSPCHWTVHTRRHFPGELYSVNPSVTRWFDNLFVLNERVSLLGTWMHGFFSYTAVGATMVGSIKLPWDEELRTNQFSFNEVTKKGYEGEFYDKLSHRAFRKGEEVGEFNLGSTIVLTFEAPKGYRFPIEENGIVKLGESLVRAPTRRRSMPNLLKLVNDSSFSESEGELSDYVRGGSFHTRRRKFRKSASSKFK